MNKRLPYFEIQGTHAEVGEFIGRQFGSHIKSVIWDRRKHIPNYDLLLSESQKYFAITQEYLPNVIQEVQAIAEASGVPVLEYFFLNNREVYDQAEAYDKKDAVKSDHCTVVAGHGPEGMVIGHNEDWALSALDDLYILKATIGTTTFLALNYRDAISGLAATMNNWGLVQCINDLHQESTIGIPQNFLARAVLECQSLNEAETLLRDLPHASGFNHVLAQGNEVRNIEIAGDRMAVEQVAGKPYAHTNHYLSPELRDYEKFHTKSSELRYERAQSLLRDTMSKADVMRILSDTGNSEYPICRADATIGSAVFLPNILQAYFCYGHPCAGEYSEYQI